MEVREYGDIPQIFEDQAIEEQGEQLQELQDQLQDQLQELQRSYIATICLAAIFILIIMTNLYYSHYYITLLLAKIEILDTNRILLDQLLDQLLDTDRSWHLHSA